MKRQVDLRELSEALVREFPTIQSLWLFGSRRHRTRSLRSDIDLLLCTSDHIRPSDLRIAIQKICPALDLFVVEGGRATSVMNESCVTAPSFHELRSKLDAMCVWALDMSEVQQEAAFVQELLDEVTYIPTIFDGGAPRPSVWSRSLQNLLLEIAQQGLPVNPYVGDSVEKVGTFLLDLTAKIISASSQLVRRKHSTWKPKIESEYDLQDLFFLATKPWLPELAREEATIIFDGQEKTADFSLLGNSIVIEMKYIDDANSKAAVIKTLKGLSDFYLRNPRVKLLLFVIGVTNDDVDIPRWEREFSVAGDDYRVITRVYPVPS